MIERLVSLVRRYLYKNKIGGVPSIPHEAESTNSVEAESSKGNKRKVRALKAKSSDERNVSYPMGTQLVEFMIERGIIRLEAFNKMEEFVVDDVKMNTPKVRKGKKSYYLYSIEKGLMAFCYFDIGLLPINWNLPMICRPEQWSSKLKEGTQPCTLFYLKGGYLTPISAMDYHYRYTPLSTHNRENFNRNIKDDRYEELCEVMHKLKNKAYKRKSAMLKLILTERDTF